MFTPFFFHLRSHGLKVGLSEWLTFLDALARGHARSDLATLYHLARSLLVHRVSDFDRYDLAFQEFFRGVEGHFDVDEALLEWLAEAELPPLDATRLPFPDDFDLDELRRTFEERMREQDERHDGGSHWIGTGGRSPFGRGGRHAAGVRVGDLGGGRSAVQVAGERRFRRLRSDRILDTRQIGVALQRLRKLDRHGVPDELDLDGTIDASARNAGDIELVFRPERRNRVRLALLMDVGGSMDPHSRISELLFSATHRAQHFRSFEARFFHNCLYERVYRDSSLRKGESTVEWLRELDERWSVVIVGDAWMSPVELLRFGALDYSHRNSVSGLDWLLRLRERCPDSVWLNPEPQRIWHATTIDAIRRVFPMFELTLDGLSAAVDVLRGARPNRPHRGPRQAA